jgi:hypothetical protein
LVVDWDYRDEVGALVAAKRAIHESVHLSRCRAIRLVELEPSILLAQARLARATGDNQRAAAYAAEGQAIAEGADYLLVLADIHNFLAQLALEGGDSATAREHAARAKACATCDGPPRYYKVAYETAERLLAAAG